MASTSEQGKSNPNKAHRNLLKKAATKRVAQEKQKARSRTPARKSVPLLPEKKTFGPFA